MRITTGPMTPDTIDRTSKVSIRVPTFADRELTANPTFEFTEIGERPKDDWAQGRWEPLGRYMAAMTPMVGGRQVVLAPNHYDVWMRVREGGETVVLKVGRLRVQ